MTGSDHLVSAWDREWFNRCRRAWDWGSHDRRDLEPVQGGRQQNMSWAIREALAVYYFPGMWDWKPVIVKPLVLERYRRSVLTALSPTTEASENGGSAATEPGTTTSVAAAAEVGIEMLQRYFDWAPSVDRFCPLQVSAEIMVAVPDPANPELALFAPDGKGVLYKDRIDAAVMDDQGVYWLVQHRVVEGDWQDLDLLSLGPRMLTACWALEQFFLVPVAGVILNELRVPRGGIGSDPAGAVQAHKRELDMKRGSILQNRHRPQLARAGLAPDSAEWFQESTPWFRRTHMPLRRDLVAAQAGAIAHEAMEIVADRVRLYPNPSRQNCGSCAFHAPCLALVDGTDAEPMLAAHYRRRPPSIEEPRLGRGYGFIAPHHGLDPHAPNPRAGATSDQS